MRVGPYDESMYYSHDYDMILRLARKNDGVFIDEPVLYQRKHLGYRGPSVEETFKLDTVGKWMKYDAILFKKLDREWSLSDFQPFHHKGVRCTNRHWLFFKRELSCFNERCMMEQYARWQNMAVSFGTTLPAP